MTDYTSLIRALRHCAKQSVCNGCPRCGKRIKNCNAELDREVADTIEELLEERDAAYLVGHQLADKLPVWIPVTERLPKKYESVFTFSKYGMQIDEYIGNYDGEDYFARYTKNVTHWMPLPEPPKEETE